MEYYKVLVVDKNPKSRKCYFNIFASINAEDDADTLSLDFFGEFDLADSPLEPDRPGYPFLENVDNKHKPIKVVESASIQDALKLVKESLEEEKLFSLIFLDQSVLPEYKYDEVASKLRMLDLHVEIVIMTSYAEYSRLQDTRKCGNPHRLLYFHVPFTAEQLIRLTYSLIQRWGLERYSTS